MGGLLEKTSLLLDRCRAWILDGWIPAGAKQKLSFTNSYGLERQSTAAVHHWMEGRRIQLEKKETIMSEQNRWADERDNALYGRGYKDEQGAYGPDSDRSPYY